MNSLIAAFYRDIADILGIRGRRITTFTLTMSIGDWPRLETNEIITDTSFLTDQIQRRRYRVVLEEIEPEGGGDGTDSPLVKQRGADGG